MTLMSKNLVIVESPAKAKTIEKYLGKDYQVKASFGHVRDLVKKGLGIDIKNNFTPTYEIMPDKKEIIKTLKSAAKKADFIYIATDLDREGEAIAWHIVDTLKIDSSKMKRIVFNEITKSAIQKAIEDGREIDTQLVDAQQARRILDRIVGFEMSPVLWRKVKAGLSAGRVQSVAVRLIVEREKSIQAFEPEAFYKITGQFKTEENIELEAEVKSKIKDEKIVEKFLKHCQNTTYKLKDIEKKITEKNPAPPFTTSSLQQEASNKLGYSVSRTMSLAQRLYEAGHITYMRTDSLNLSNEAISQIGKYVTETYGEEYTFCRIYKAKTKGAQEAHEAIRATNVTNLQVSDDNSEQKLYELIRKRALATQMSPAKIEKTTAKIDCLHNKYNFQAQGEIIVFDGFLKCYENPDSKANSKALPQLNENMPLTYKEITATERFSKAPARFTEASLVKQLEELGIGRPSTYAPTISTVQKRNYVLKESREGTPRNYKKWTLTQKGLSQTDETENHGSETNKLFPTDIGILTNNFLVEHFENIMNFNFTASVEEQFDEIADGKMEWQRMITNFYKPFHTQVEDVKETSERVSGEREMGTDPNTGKKIIVRMGKFGPMAQIGSSDDEEKPVYAGLQKGQSLETITFEEVLDLFKLPREVGFYKDKPMIAAIGRFGPYIKYDGLFASLKKEQDPLTIEESEAIELVEVKLEAEKNKYIHKFEDHDPPVYVMNGRYGAYISSNKKNYKIPKDTDANSLNIDKCLKIMENGPTQRRKKRR